MTGPTRLDSCVKIHEGCGGVCRWVEAVEKAGVGYTATCLECGEVDIVIEDILPMENVDHKDVLNAGVQNDLADLEWDDNLGWDENQRRLTEALPDQIPTTNRTKRRRQRRRRSKNQAIGEFTGG